MAVFPRSIKDRAIQYPRRYTLTNISGETYDLDPVTGTVTEAGTAVNKLLLQPIEDILGLSGISPYTANLTDLIYSGPDLIRVDEKVGGVLRRETTLSYTGPDLTSVATKTFDTNGTTVLQHVTDTLGYDLGNLISVTRVVVV